jgi:hypothetical protein
MTKLSFKHPIIDIGCSSVRFYFFSFFLSLPPSLSSFHSYPHLFLL